MPLPQGSFRSRSGHYAKLSEHLMKLYSYLSYAGAAPFIVCAALLSLDINSLPVLGATYDVLLVYALVINTFLAGCHWGQHLGLADAWSRRLPSLSNASAVLLWLGFLMLPEAPLIVLFVANFIALLLVDRKLFQAGIISSDYWQTRCRVTSVVVLSLVAALLL